MFLPWYSLQSVDRRTETIQSTTINAFGDVSFVEAAVFLVAAGVIVLLFARAEGAVPDAGGDGRSSRSAGAWAGPLIFYRVFSRPPGNGYPVGIEWGFFLAFIAAGALPTPGCASAPPNARSGAPPRGRGAGPAAPRRHREAAPRRAAAPPVAARPGTERRGHAASSHSRIPRPSARYPPAPPRPR